MVTLNNIPEIGFTGTDEFEYMVCYSDNSCCSEGKVTLDVTDKNSDCSGDIMLLHDDNFMDCNGEGVFASLIDNDMVINNVDYNLDIVLTQSPSNGEASIDDIGNLSYNADEGFFGSDVFEYRVCVERAQSELIQHSSSGSDLPLGVVEGTASSMCSIEMVGDGFVDKISIRNVRITQNDISEI